MEPDERKNVMLARLTESEKECLRRRLLPQTAKEMALDLGISPHAVEKRLKMARAKLGVSSSLDAARLLAASEGYQPLVPHASDLSGGGASGEAGAVAVPQVGAGARTLPTQGLFMITILALLASVAQDVPAADPSASPMFDEKGRTVAARKVGSDEADAYLRESFASMDTDHSGYFDAVEVGKLEPRDRHRDTSLPPAPPPGARDPAGERKWMDLLDHNRDGRVSSEEYRQYMLPWTLLSGVPADWHKRD
ncbi:EF-hand domain-containing protein [uncultured Sphingomonas sp.]|uniref:EF-hand domain-containing protein n=1 Tax=uncultured Sphingomonas sp. TaxID=158754 RepID=UPI0030FBC191